MGTVPVQYYLYLQYYLRVYKFSMCVPKVYGVRTKFINLVPSGTRVQVDLHDCTKFSNSRYRFRILMNGVNFGLHVEFLNLVDDSFGSDWFVL